MPIFVLSTNLPQDDIPQNLLADLTSQLAKATKKPSEIMQCVINTLHQIFYATTSGAHKKYIAVHIVPNQIMSFGGTTDPCALCSLHSIGRIGISENKAYTKLFADILSKQLNIPANRCYINYCDLDAANVGWNGNTFA